ncbi:MAG: hypothetical protein ABJA98_22215 [Acidobacteriota bacterium]
MPPHVDARRDACDLQGLIDEFSGSHDAALQNGHRGGVFGQVPSFLEKLKRRHGGGQWVAKLMRDEREVFVRLTQELSISLVGVFGDGMCDTVNCGIEYDLELLKGKLRTGVPCGADDGVAEGAVLTHDRIQAEAQSQSLFAMSRGAQAFVG